MNSEEFQSRINALLKTGEVLEPWSPRGWIHLPADFKVGDELILSSNRPNSTCYPASFAVPVRVRIDQLGQTFGTTACITILSEGCYYDRGDKQTPWPVGPVDGWYKIPFDIVGKVVNRGIRES